jgi:hypothetical protein
MPPVVDTPCPNCGATELRIEHRLQARPIGSFSLSGVQTKVTAREWPWLVCGACGVEAPGKPEPPPADPTS